MHTTYSGSITIYPLYNHMPEEFHGQLIRAAETRKPTLVYQNTTFQLKWHPNGTVDVTVKLDSVDATRPEVFDDHNLTIRWVVLECSVPQTLLAKPGLYVGENFGLPSAMCVIDPRGVHNNGTPVILATGESYDHVQTLFQQVMSGELEPGFNGKPFDCTVYNPK